MAEVKWIKIVTDVFDDEKILLIESMPDSDSIIVIWFKLLCLAGKINNGGVLMLNDKIAYTDEMLAAIFRKPINTVRLALKTFENFGMVELVNNVITIPNWSKHQTLEQLEERKEYMKNYMREYRERQKLIAIGENVNKCKANSKANVNALEVDIDKELDIDIEGEEDIEETITSTTLTKENIEAILNAWNKLGLQQLKSINANTNRHKMLKARLKEYSLEEILETIESIAKSTFLKGQNNRSWVITFDWFIKPNNFLKVLEGNYVDKVSESNPAKNAPVQQVPKTKTKFHLAKSRGDKYSADELEQLILGNQKNRRVGNAGGTDNIRQTGEDEL